MSDLQHERITALAVELRLGAMADLYGAIAQDAAKAKDASYADFLEQILRGGTRCKACALGVNVGAHCRLPSHQDA